MSDSQIEQHPLSPFYPEKARWLFLGSFPPQQQRWSMDFFYPNFQNDMWRIFGLIFFQDKNRFVDTVKKTFHKEAIVRFLTSQRIAMYDMAESVIRRQNNASDKDLEIVTPLNIAKVVRQLSDLQIIVTTGQKASDTLIKQLQQENIPMNPLKAGKSVLFSFSDNRNIRLYRMPSSSRAYPLSLEAKAKIYKTMFDETKEQIGQ